jgi:hypothetical protein
MHATIDSNTMAAVMRMPIKQIRQTTTIMAITRIGSISFSLLVITIGGSVFIETFDRGGVILSMMMLVLITSCKEMDAD